MKRSTKTMLIAVAAIALSLGAVVVVANQKNGGLLNAIATHTTNEYGCEQNCTGEYYPSHINQLVKNDTSLNLTKDVRIIAKATPFKKWVVDVDNTNSYQSTSDETFINDRANDQLVAVVGAFSGLSYEVGDTIGFFGTVHYCAAGKGYVNETIEIINPTVYKVNSQVDLTLLPEVVYLS